MQKRAVFTMTAIVVAFVTATSAAPARAITMPDLAAPTPSEVLNVSDHHHNCHRRGHQVHGYDDYYNTDDANGTLFKAFVMGELTGSHKATTNRAAY